MKTAVRNSKNRLTFRISYGKRPSQISRNKRVSPLCVTGQQEE